MRYVVAFVVLALEALLQVTVFSRLSLLGITPQLLLLSVIAWSLIRGPVEGMFWGFLGGLFFDLAGGNPIGVSALAMVVVAALAGLAGRALFGSNALFPLTMVFVLSGLYVLVCGFLMATLHYPTDWNGVLHDVLLPTALANTLFGLLVYPLFLFVNSHTHGQVRVEI